MSNELIVVKQLPIIEERLKGLSEEIDKKVENAKALVCTEDTVKVVKEKRAELNKQFKELESQRKEIKNQIFAPYLQFEEVYKVYVSDKFKSADVELKDKVDSVEKELKLKKEQEVKDYFEEYKLANNIDFAKYEQANINVTLSASMKSLKEQAKFFIDRIVSDLNLIKTQENKTEILVEYKQDLNVSRAITVVSNRIKALEQEREKQLKQQEELVNRKLEEETQLAKKAIEPFLEKPVEEIKEEILTLKFTVKGTRTKLKELKTFLENGGYEYE